MTSQLHLVGSIPFDTVEEVFTTFGATLGSYLRTLPDGEVGPRSHWISRVHYQVFALHPDLEVVQQPSPEAGVERLVPRNVGDAWKFRVRDGVSEIRFGDPGWRLGFARDAVNSYAIFRTLREKGVIPAHLRFQVSIPMVGSAVPPRIFVKDGDCEIVRRGYEDALAAEISTIAARIPARDLALQWDCASELQDAYGAIPGLAPESMVERTVGPMGRLSPLLPEEAELGCHLCFGTMGGWPRFEPDDLSGAVTLANAVVDGAGRRVDWLHIPVLDRSDDGFFAPLAGLRPQGARIYLGAIHNMSRYPGRLAAARKYLPAFGVGAYCGFGRLSPKELRQILDDHVAAAEAG